MKSTISLIRTRIREAAASPGVRRYFFNTGWMFAEKALRLIAGLFIGAYVARYLGPAQYGLLNYVISLVALFAVIAPFGIETIVIRELVKDASKRDRILGTAFVLRLAGALTTVLLLFVFTRFFDQDPLTQTMIFIIVCGTCVEIVGVIDYFFQSQVLSKYVVWSQMIALTIVSIFRIVLVIQDAPLMWFAWSGVIDLSLLSFGLIFFYSKKSMSVFSWKFDVSIMKLLLRGSWPLVFSSFAVTVYMKIDQVMIKWMIDDAATGNYGVAVRLSEMWNFIPIAICGSLFPAILNAKATSEEQYLRRLQRLFDLMVMLSIAIAIPMTFLSDFVVRLLFGNEYTSAGTVLAIYIWSSVFTFLGVANGKWIISENLQVHRMVSYMIAAVLNIVLNYVLIKAIGIYGPAISTLISYSFAVYFSLLFSKRTRPMFVSGTKAFDPIGVFKRLLN